MEKIKQTDQTWNGNKINDPRQTVQKDEAVVGVCSTVCGPVVVRGFFSVLLSYAVLWEGVVGCWVALGAIIPLPVGSEMCVCVCE